MSKKSSFRRPFDKQHGNWTQTLLKSQLHCLYDIYGSVWGNLSWKIPLIVICKILGLFVNTMTVGDKYSLLNRDNLTQPIQMQLSRK